MNNETDIFLEFIDAGDMIRIEPVSLTYPHAELDWDRNWIKCNVSVKGGVFSGQFVADFMTTDFEHLKQQLKKLDNDFTGTVLFEPVEQQLVLKIRGDGLGHFELDCEATPEPHLDATLSFSLSFDQTQIRNYIQQLNRITRTFPIDGNFNIQNE